MSLYGNDTLIMEASTRNFGHYSDTDKAVEVPLFALVLLVRHQIRERNKTAVVGNHILASLSWFADKWIPKPKDPCALERCYICGNLAKTEVTGALARIKCSRCANECYGNWTEWMNTNLTRLSARLAEQWDEQQRAGCNLSPVKRSLVDEENRQRYLNEKLDENILVLKNEILDCIDRLRGTRKS
jgi:hypothetical protein